MAYRSDSDISFLGDLPSKDLDALVYCLTHDTDGEVRWTEELTSDSSYKAYYPDHNKYWREIAAELQCFGANTFMTIFRGGEGVPYKEVLTDVCDKLDVNYNENSSVEIIEDNLLMKILEKSINEMSSDELRRLCDSMGIKKYDTITPEIITGALQTIFRMGGFKSYQLTLIAVNAIWKALFGTGLTFATNATITRILSIWAGPIGWAITALWTTVDIAGPAYRVTIPATLQVALLRKKHKYGNTADQISFG